jgi:hypothetical protein
MAFWKKSVSPPKDPGMKTIVYRGGVVTFRIPSYWCEEYSDFEGGAFFEDSPDSGTLRLKVIALAAPDEVGPNSAMEILQVAIDRIEDMDADGSTKVREDGNAVLRYEHTTYERDTPLTIYYWVVANPVPPRHARIATFSYTVLAERRNEPETQRELLMLQDEIDSATFWSKIGE